MCPNSASSPPAGPSVADAVARRLRPVLQGQGIELWLAEFGGRPPVLRLAIDQEGGVSLDDCSRVSRQVADLLDAEGFGDDAGWGAAAPQGRYTLEVSSPGLDRKLVTPEHFRRFVGHPLKFKAAHRGLEGMLQAADDYGIVVRLEDGSESSFAYDQIERARLVPTF